MKHLIFTLLFVFLLLSCNDSQKEQSTTPPNIVLILTDDQGFQDIGPNGAVDFQTPNIDQLASEGVVLDNYYAPQAVCSASRAGILTGCYPNRIGIHNALMPKANKGLNPSEVTLAELLKTKGYATGIFGKWHLGDHKEAMPLNHGFDEYFGIPYSNDMWPNHPYQGKWFNFDPLFLYENNKVIDTLTDQSQLTTQITERSVAFINKHKDEPFFLYVPHPQPHVPLFVSDKFKGKSKRGLYGDVIMEIDWSVGQIVKTLKENGLEENTIIIFTSDNGPWLSYGNHAGSALPYREGKGTAWEGGQREPFVIKYPKEIPMGKRSHTPVMGIDVLPTLAKQVDASLPDHPIDGKDVWEVFTLKTDKSPQEAYFFYYRVNELHAVRSGDWKLYFPHNYRTMKGQAPGKDGIPGDYSSLELKEQELYNLITDESETTNVASQHPEIVKKLNQLADQMRLKLGDNLSGMESGIETREPAYYNIDQ